MLSQRFLLSRIAFIRLTESNYIYFILILDQPHRTNFTVAKVSNTSEGNCTIFNFKSESTKCKHTHNIYLFNSMELFIYQLLNQSEEEIRICNNSFLFENIKFAKAQSVWRGETSYQLRHFVPVLEGKISFFDILTLQLTYKMWNIKLRLKLEKSKSTALIIVWFQTVFF